MKDPNVEALNKRTCLDVICTLILAGVFALSAGFKLLHHDPGTACCSAFLFVIFLLTGLIFLDIRKNGKPFAASVITKMRILAVTVMSSGIVSEVVDSMARSSREHTEIALRLDDRFIIFTVLLGIIIGILSEIFVYGHALQNDMDQIA